MIGHNNLRVLLVATLLGLSLNLSAHEGHANTKAIQVCHDKALASDCAYVLGKKLYKGSCRIIANKSMCVRSAPIELLTEDTELNLTANIQDKKN
ncbi:hypothetical protein [uncultured Paraglaciecola sp.]|uniref:hypothetical protein n=1 Tax=uncultured Paraglaciecola sp. TaxID=1765024 RepID=UPI0030D8ED93|tara:strand:+ start:3721 stop:4005 length:285 start_codon:yes stop_codon:yes gene_type:complete